MVHVMQQMFVKPNLLRTASNNFGVKSRYFSETTTALLATGLWLPVHTPGLALRQAISSLHTRYTALHTNRLKPICWCFA